MSNSPTVDAISSPVGFAVGVLGLKLYPWQEAVLWDMDRPGSVALKAANGSGKTACIAAPLALWHATVFPGSLTICTAGVYRQVSEQLFPAIRSHAQRFPGWSFTANTVEGTNGSRILGFSTDEPGKFEGWHNDNLLVIVDEAKTVPDPIFEAIARCQPKRLLVMSSPGGPNGFFYECFGTRRKFYRTHSVAASECPHISPAWIAEQIDKFGESHPLVRSMVFAEFMTGGEDGAVVPLSWVERCIANPPAFVDAPPKAFCDFAAGGDENVLSVLRGNRVTIAGAWRERDTMKAVGRFIQLFSEHRLQRHQVYADAGGLGIVMCDRMAEVGWNVHRVNNGSAPGWSPMGDANEIYANRGAQTWYEGARLIERREVILPNDPVLVAQLTTRKGWPDSRGRLCLEPKETMRARGLPSPDRADAVLGAIANVHDFPIMLA